MYVFLLEQGFMEEYRRKTWNSVDREVLTLRSFLNNKSNILIRGSCRGRGIPRASPAMVRSEKIHSKGITYLDQKSTDSNEAAE